MSIVKGTEKIINPLQESALNKKGLCDYVVNVASGCLHGCTFCYVPSTPAIRTKQAQLREQGVSDPQMDWGKYLFVREEIPEQLEKTLSRKKSWRVTPEGKGVVLLCSGTDPYQNKQTANVTRGAVQALLHYKKRIRILTRSPLWVNDINIFKDPNVIVGMSLPYLDDELSRQIEPQAPLPSERYKALIKGHKAGCRLYVAIAPTPPNMNLDDFKRHLYKIMQFDPEVIFWEPINARGTNGKRMIAAGLEFASSIMTKSSWGECFKRQWDDIEAAAREVGCEDRLHIWPDPELRGYVDEAKIAYWLYKPTVEKWNSMTVSESKVKPLQPVRNKSQTAITNS
ncbi:MULTISPECIES: radical SAM protein [unclassified Nostoc]|uniref:SPL family radical SAM protein n=1 Tax=unclassified Nostoc TaxID=2593658 RepID=UPI000DEC8BDC|nr:MULTISPECIES: radical SAM protein [unclassified Nostoc]MBE8987117.1 radical SAM protein [Nostoc sp. LEGE 12450]QHG19306.1 radical SAM protein [Nostoc sp. ATCC 53789]RCJ27899.1 radical SAM protein [Nostoc sp. ATCC 53789]